MTESQSCAGLFVVSLHTVFWWLGLIGCTGGIVVSSLLLAAVASVLAFRLGTGGACCKLTALFANFLLFAKLPLSARDATLPCLNLFAQGTPPCA